MESKSITVNLLPDKKVELTSDSPDLKKLVQAIVECRDRIDPEKIGVECADESFDSKGFADIVSVATKLFLEESRIDRKKLDAVLAKIDEGAELS